METPKRKFDISQLPGLLKSKRFWVAVLGIAVIVLERAGVLFFEELTQSDIDKIANIVLLLIGAFTVRDPGQILNVLGGLLGGGDDSA